MADWSTFANQALTIVKLRDSGLDTAAEIEEMAATPADSVDCVILKLLTATAGLDETSPQGKLLQSVLSDLGMLGTITRTR